MDAKQLHDAWCPGGDCPGGAACNFWRDLVALERAALERAAEEVIESDQTGTGWGELAAAVIRSLIK